MAIIAVEYTYTAGDTEHKDAIRPAHREFLRDLNALGVVISSGPFVGSDGALVIVNAESPDAALAALDADPFLTENVVIDRSAREWNPVIGSLGA